MAIFISDEKEASDKEKARGFIFFSLSIFLLSLLVSSVQQSDSGIHTHVSILFQILPSFTVFLNTEQSSLCCMVGPQWLLILNIADPLAMYCISRMYKIIAFPSL